MSFSPVVYRGSTCVAFIGVMSSGCSRSHSCCVRQNESVARPMKAISLKNDGRQSKGDSEEKRELFVVQAVVGVALATRINCASGSSGLSGFGASRSSHSSPTFSISCSMRRSCWPRLRHNSTMKLRLRGFGIDVRRCETQAWRPADHWFETSASPMA